MRKRTLRPNEPSQITEKVLVRIAEDLKAGKPPLPKLAVVDDMVPGLRFIIYKNGEIAIHASYVVGERRPFLKLGVLKASPDRRQEGLPPQELSLAEARQLVRDIKSIGLRGIDIQEGLVTRLLAELKRDGAAWRPAMSPPASRKG